MSSPSTSLSGQKALVLGGSTGIGFAVAQVALAHGVEVILSSSSQPKLDKAVRLLLDNRNSDDKSSVPKVTAKVCDLGESAPVEQNIQDLLEFATEDGRKLDHAVYTAGDFFALPTLATVTVDEVRLASHVRITGAIMVAKHLPRYMNPSTTSSFTITGSTTQKRPQAGWSIVNGASGGTEPLTRALAIDLKPVRVNCVIPGFVHTELFDGFSEEQVDQIIPAMAKESVVERMGKANEVAEAFLYLMKCNFATASSVVVDGGREIV